MSKDPLQALVMPRVQIEALKAKGRYYHGGFGKPGSKGAERRYVHYKLYLYRKYL